MDALDRTQVGAAHYAYRVVWSAEDAEYVATCVEFPSLSWLASTRNAAIDGLEALVAEVTEDMRANGEEVPVPMSERRYSGTFNLRIGENLHRSLVMHAAEERVSLNQYVSKKLAAG